MSEEPWMSPEMANAWLNAEMERALSEAVLNPEPIYYTDRWRGRLIDRANDTLDRWLFQDQNMRLPLSTHK